MEKFYSIRHLSTGQLRDIYLQYRQKGWVDYSYYKLMPEGVTPSPLTDEEILSNIDAVNPSNYFVFMLNHEDEQDGIMIGFGLSSYPDFGVYLHLDKIFLNEIIKKYNLSEFRDEEGLLVKMCLN